MATDDGASSRHVLERGTRQSHGPAQCTWPANPSSRRTRPAGLVPPRAARAERAREPRSRAAIAVDRVERVPPLEQAGRGSAPHPRFSRRGCRARARTPEGDRHVGATCRCNEPRIASQAGSAAMMLATSASTELRPAGDRRIAVTCDAANCHQAYPPPCAGASMCCLSGWAASACGDSRCYTRPTPAQDVK
jgi:hypothetical protein